MLANFEHFSTEAESHQSQLLMMMIIMWDRLSCLWGYIHHCLDLKFLSKELMKHEQMTKRS